MEHFRNSISSDKKLSIARTPRPRRRTTGIVRRLRSCHTDEKCSGSSSRSSSLPMMCSTSNADCAPRPATSTFRDSTHSVPFAPYVSMPMLMKPSLQLPSTSATHRNHSLVMSEFQASNKRKRDVEDDPAPMQPPAQRYAGSEPPHSSNGIDLDSMKHTPALVLASSGCPVTSTMLQFSCNPHSNIKQTSMPPPVRLMPHVGQPSNGDASDAQQFHWRNSDPRQPLSISTPQRLTITVPARLVPDQSVSPKTQTVEISRTSFANQAQAQKMMMLQRGMMANCQPPPRQVARNSVPRSHNNQTSAPRSLPPQAVFAVGPRKPQPQPSAAPRIPQASPSDLARRPSLYKVPPWPSPPSQPSHTHRPSSATTPHSPNSSPMRGLGTKPSPNPQNAETMRAQAPARHNMQYSRPAQVMMPITPPRTPPFHSPPQSMRTSSPLPFQQQQNLNKHKHSPNL